MEYQFVLTLVFFVRNFACLSPDVAGYFPDIDGGVEFSDGDVIISGLFDLHKYSESKPCGTRIDISGTYRALAFVYAVDEINRRTDILPNIKLGYVFIDCCKKDTTALARSLYTVPDKRWFNPTCSASNLNRTCLGGFDYFPVAGSIGPQSSLIARLTTSVLGLFHIPQISNYVTSDEYSSRIKYPYFLRTAPPDRYQVVTMQNMLDHFGWGYVSAVFYDDYYGRAAIKALGEAMIEIEACFAVKEMVDHVTTPRQWDTIVQRLIDHKEARVVVLFLYSTPILTLVKALKKRKVENEFILIASDSISVLTTSPGSMDILPEGMMGVSISSVPFPAFDKYFKSLTTAFANSSLILHDFWESIFNCSMSHGAKNRCGPSLRFTESYGFMQDPSVSVVVDSVNVMAKAMDSLMKRKCPTVRGKDVRDCLIGSELIAELRNIKLEGITGSIEFNEDGDLVGNYNVINIQTVNGRKTALPVALYNIGNKTLTRTKNKIRWPSGFEVSDNSTSPQSNCSTPCRPNQQKIQKDVQCCWECRDCRENEYVTENHSKCIPCEQFYWPEQENFTTCLEIAPVVMEWHDIECIAVTFLTGFGLALTLIMFVLFTKYRSVKLIKASSIELMYAILIAVFWSLLMVFSFLSYPDEVTCYANFFGFNVSFASSYAPLLVKARRIFAIFASGKKTTKAPPMISSQSQIVICLVLVFIQVLISVTICLIDRPFPQRIMLVPTKKLVEIGCHATPITIMVPLSYNLVLVIACTIYAFKSRRIPANFNETRFISFSVYTTLILWMALIPTYYTANTEKFKIIYLTLAMIIHSYVIHICLFLPKLYAVIYLKEEDIQGLQGRVSSTSAHNGPAVIGMEHMRSPCQGKRYSEPCSAGLRS